MGLLARNVELNGLFQSNKDFIATQWAGRPGRIVARKLSIAVSNQSSVVHPVSQFIFPILVRFSIDSSGKSDDGKSPAEAFSNSNVVIRRFGNALLSYFLAE